MVGLMRAILRQDRRTGYRLHVRHPGTKEASPPRNSGHKKPGLNIGSAGIKIVPGLFSELFNVAASRPAQMTTEWPKHSRQRAFRQAMPEVNGGIKGRDRGQPPLRRFEP